MARRVLIAGIGNVFFGDDGFGPEVSRRLARRALPAGVEVRDFGIRGLDLTYALLDGWDAAILVDALPRGGEPGTLYVVEPDQIATVQAPDPHAMHPVRVLAMAQEIGPTPKTLRVVGCEPAAAAEMEMGLSPAVSAAIDPACALVEKLARELS
ncbi:MAG: hydrogenase maturation protease [Myxococcales bacterium]|nr:hydrogenase maturation protease [Myxococcales bacterium]